MKKLNWGHSIFIAIVVCMISILTLVFKTVNQKIELVTEDYYPKELKYEDQITKQKNSAQLNNSIEIEIDDSIKIIFPKELEDHSLIKGEIWFYRASKMKDDIKDSIYLTNSYSISYPLSKFSNGKYQVIIDWSYDKTSYLFKEDIYIEKY